MSKEATQTASVALIDGDEVRVSITGRPIGKLSVVDVRGRLPGGLRLGRPSAR